MAFHDSKVVRCASAGYAELEVTTRVLFVPFEPAFGLLHELVDDLEIPD